MRWLGDILEGLEGGRKKHHHHHQQQQQQQQPQQQEPKAAEGAPQGAAALQVARPGGASIAAGPAGPTDAAASAEPGRPDPAMAAAAVEAAAAVDTLELGLAQVGWPSNSPAPPSMGV